MFTIHQIKEAHAKVKTGAGFPQYVQDIIKLGVVRYETYVLDGHTRYHGKEGFSVLSDPKYTALNIADRSDAARFRQKLREHQQGKTDYPAFCHDCAQSGIEKWTVDTQAMTCTYYDKAGDETLIETIPVA